MIQHYLIVYCNDGTIHLWPGKDYNECTMKLKKMKENKKIISKIKSSTIIKRDTSYFKEGLMFGKKNIL